MRSRGPGWRRGSRTDVDLSSTCRNFAVGAKIAPLVSRSPPLFDAQAREGGEPVGLEVDEDAGGGRWRVDVRRGAAEDMRVGLIQAGEVADSLPRLPRETGRQETAVTLPALLSGLGGSS